MRLSATIVSIFVAVFLFAADRPSASAESYQRNASVKTAQTHKVKKSSKNVTIKRGDSLSKIANRHDTTYKRLFNANTKIKNPNIIFAGDVIRVPHASEKLKPRALPTTVKQSASKPVQKPAKPVTARPVQKQQPRAASTVKPSAARPVVAKPAPKPVAAAPARSTSTGVWDRLAMCEASGNWSINTGNGYYGGLQFTLSSWRAVGGTGYPHQASKAEQIMRAEKLQAIQGWGAWPACTAKLGIR